MGCLNVGLDDLTAGSLGVADDRSASVSSRRMKMNLLHAVPHLSNGSLVDLALDEWDDLFIGDQLAVLPLKHHGA